MKIMTILGTRPEIIRLSIILKKLDLHFDHFVFHTGQNHDYELDQIFFDQLEIRQPNAFGCAKGSFACQISTYFPILEKCIKDFKPDAVLTLGDTNSSLGVLVAKKFGIKVFHMEAGNRCYCDEVPEEINRKVIDHLADIHMPYTEHSRRNLLNEGIRGDKIYVTGNPITEILKNYRFGIDNSSIIQKINNEHLDIHLQRGNYFLITLHRSENVDDLDRLGTILNSIYKLTSIYQDKYFVVSVHPHLRSKMDEIEWKDDKGISFWDSIKNILFMKPFGFFDFVKLEQNAFCVLSDSGTVQEECSILKIPNVILRYTTERPEIMEHGRCVLTSKDGKSFENSLTKGIELVTSIKKSSVPVEYTVDNVSDTVLRIIQNNYK